MKPYIFFILLDKNALKTKRLKNEAVPSKNVPVRQFSPRRSPATLEKIQRRRESLVLKRAKCQLKLHNCIADANKENVPCNLQTNCEYVHGNKYDKTKYSEIECIIK